MPILSNDAAVGAFVRAQRLGSTSLTVQEFTLDEIFGCTRDGGVFVAERADGSLASIRDVPSGLACNCICPGCRRPLVAKKGDVQAHHFAHHAMANGATCISAGETALHKYAKELLNRRLVLGIPGLVIGDEGDKETVVTARRWSFERADLEQRQGEIVPDVVVHSGGRRLIVEFMVTHACDETKIERIRQMDIGAIEVDLSGYREANAAQLAKAILFDAPRQWLHNPRTAAAAALIAQRKADRAAERAARVAEASGRYVHKKPSADRGNGRFEDAVRQEGMAKLINLPVLGAGCFSVPVAEWQAYVLATITLGQPISVDRLLGKMDELGWVEPSFQKLPVSIAADIAELNPNFATPYGAIRFYLSALRERSATHERDDIWMQSAALAQQLDAARAKRLRPIRRRQEIHDLVMPLINALPDPEREGFDFEVWAQTEIPGLGHSVAHAVHFDDEQWFGFRKLVTKLVDKLGFRPKADLDLLGLPLQAELTRIVERDAAKDAERVRVRQEEADAAAAKRERALKVRAWEALGGYAEEWLVSPQEKLQGMTPVESARSSPAGDEKAFYALDRRIREYEAEQKRLGIRDQAIETLRSEVERVLDRSRARLWMTTTQPRLGMSPEAYVVDEVTLARCRELLPAKR